MSKRVVVPLTHGEFGEIDGFGKKMLSSVFGHVEFEIPVRLVIDGQQTPGVVGWELWKEIKTKNIDVGVIYLEIKLTGDLAKETENGNRGEHTVRKTQGRQNTRRKEQSTRSSCRGGKEAGRLEKSL